MIHWNKGQLAGMQASGAEILISASAGAGKTAVLTERLIRQLTDPESPLDMERFIFVTFTNAAAQEMRRRVRRGIEDRALQAPEDSRLARQRLLLGQAAISTLHGFCLELIRRYYKELGIDPRSRVLSEAEQLLLQAEILDGYLEECYEANEPGFAALTALYGGERSDGPFKQLIQRVYALAVSQPHPLAWLKGSTGLYRKEERAESLISLLTENLKEGMQTLIRDLDKGIRMAGRLPSLSKYETCLREDRDKIRGLESIEDWDALVGAMASAKTVFGRLPTIATKAAKGEAPEAYALRLTLQPGIKEIRDQCKKNFNGLALTLAGESRETMEEEFAGMAPAMQALSALTSGFYQRYEQAKRDKAVLDFNDIEQYTISLLLDDEGGITEIAKALRERYEEILVDEYQDINPVQEAILQALRGRRLVMVGDIKQSIYGFRQAAPRLFLEKFRRFGEGDEGVLVNLTENFRSSQWITAGVNQVFDHCMTAENAGVDYRREGRFSCASPLPEEACPEDGTETGRGALELHLIDLSRESQASGQRDFAAAAGVEGQGIPDDLWETEPDDPWETIQGASGESFFSEAPAVQAADVEDENLQEPGVLQAEASFCAERIRRLCAEKLWDRAQERLRPVRYRDIVILLPAMKGVAEEFAAALRNRGIPVYADMGGGYFQAQEVQTVLSFLKLLDNPRQDIPLAALLLSPAIGFRPEQLGRIRAAWQESVRARADRGDAGSRNGKWGGLYKALAFAAGREKTLGIQGIKGFLKLLQRYRLYARQASVADVLLRFYEETGFLTMSAAMAGGMQRRANLLALVQRAREYEESNLQGLYSFIKYIEALEKKAADLAPAPIVGEGEDLVRILSIHKSKGLEFPVVILATAGRRFNLRESQSDLLLHERFGIVSKVILPDQRVKYTGAYHRLVGERIRKEMIAERQRLLYVAMTRAEQRLIVLSADKHMQKRIEVWQEADSGDSLKAGSFMDWLGPAVLGREEPSVWTNRVWAAGDIFPESGGKQDEQQLWQAFVSAGDPRDEGSEWAFIGNQLDWAYPWRQAAATAAKLSVTQARGRLYPEEDPEAAEAAWRAEEDLPGSECPAFMQGEEALSPGEKGSLLHRALAKIQPKEAESSMEESRAKGMTSREAALHYLQELFTSLEEREVMRSAETATLDREMLVRFLLSDLFHRMALADAGGECRQEASFTMTVPAARLYPEWQSGQQKDLSAETVVLQGTIDVYFKEGDRLILADYKSDRIASGHEEDLLKRYGSQLRLYAEGLEGYTGKPVGEMLLFSLPLGKAIRLEQ